LDDLCRSWVDFDGFRPTSIFCQESAFLGGIESESSGFCWNLHENQMRVCVYCPNPVECLRIFVNNPLRFTDYGEHAWNFVVSYPSLSDFADFL